MLSPSHVPVTLATRLTSAGEHEQATGHLAEGPAVSMTKVSSNRVRVHPQRRECSVPSIFTDISDLTTLDRSHPTPNQSAFGQDSSRTVSHRNHG